MEQRELSNLEKLTTYGFLFELISYIVGYLQSSHCNKRSKLMTEGGGGGGEPSGLKIKRAMPSKSSVENVLCGSLSTVTLRDVDVLVVISADLANAVRTCIPVDTNKLFESPQ